jgi:hypothetical protein
MNPGQIAVLTVTGKNYTVFVKRKKTSFFYYINFVQSNRLLLTIKEGFCGNHQVGLQVQTLTPDIVKVGRTIL